MGLFQVIKLEGNMSIIFSDTNMKKLPAYGEIDSFKCETKYTSLTVPYLKFTNQKNIVSNILILKYNEVQ